MHQLTTIIPADSISIPEHWREYIDMAQGYIDDEMAESTRICYRNDFKLFVTWCNSIGAPSLPSNEGIVAMYISHIANAGKKVSTINRRLSAISYMHIQEGYPSPTNARCVKAAMASICKKKGSAPVKKAAASVEYTIAMIAQCADTKAGIRDRALFALCLAGAFRGSEPLSLNIDDLERVPEGYIATLRRSKTDQQGRSKRKGIANGQHIRCADLLREWLDVLVDDGIVDGPIFRPINRGGNIEKRVNKCRLGYRSFLKLVKHYIAQAGLDPHVFGTHSFRRGFVTESFRCEADASDIMGVTDHAKYESMLEYKETKDLFSRNPGRLFL